MRQIFISLVPLFAFLGLAGSLQAWPPGEEFLDLWPAKARWAGLTHITFYKDIGDYAEAPADETLHRVRVEWKEAEAESSWGKLRIRGRLIVEGGDRAGPVDWFQGIRVLVSRQSDSPLDWSNGPDKASTLIADLVARKDGTFTASFDLEEIPRPVGSHGKHQIGAVLGLHKGHEVFYEAKAPLLADSVAMLALPGPPKLSPTLALINAASQWPDRAPEPAAIIKAVNRLHSLGKRQALDALREYVKLAPDRFNPAEEFEPANIEHGNHNVAFWIVRLLFEPAQAGTRIPKPLLGAPVPSPDQNDMKLWPLFPIELVDDVPFMIPDGWNLGGRPEHPESHLEWAERYGVLREGPLHPADDPLGAADRLLSLPKSQRLDRLTDAIHRQAWQLVAHLLPVDAGPDEEYESFSPAKWTILRKLATRRKVHWDEKSQAYTVEPSANE
jgi:hypothetical protein